MKISNFLKVIIAVIFMITISCNKEKGSVNKEQVQEVSPKYVIQNNIESTLLKGMNNPDSYEFVELRHINGITYKDNIEDKRGFLEPVVNVLPDYKKYLTSVDSVEQSIGDKVNDTIVHWYIIRFREINENNAKVLRDKDVLLKEGKVIYLNDKNTTDLLRFKTNSMLMISDSREYLPLY